MFLSDPRMIGAGWFAGALVYTDALGQARCGLTGVLTTACACADDIAYGVMPRPGYRGQLQWDWDTEEHYLPAGQAPLALTAGPTRPEHPAMNEPINCTKRPDLVPNEPLLILCGPDGKPGILMPRDDVLWNAEHEPYCIVRVPSDDQPF